MSTPASPPHNSPTFSSLLQSRLGRHLIWVLIIKLILLSALWYVFIKPHRVEVDAATMRDHMLGQPAINNQEIQHDRHNSR
jgi:hypothetical protein